MRDHDRIEVAERPNLVLVDDDKELVLSIQRRLSGWINVLPAVSGESALMLLKDVTNVSILATDLRMPNMDGVELLEKAKGNYPDIHRILFTGYPDISEIQRAVDNIGVLAVIFKPFSALEFLEYVHMIHPQEVS
ncbi:MAG: response regulator [Rhodospirillaceae bacterium]